MASINTALRRVKDDPGAVLQREWVLAACRQIGHRWRDRALDPFLTVVSMVVQVMHGNVAIAHVVRLMHNCFNESAYCQARGRLPLGAVLLLLGGMARRVRCLLDDPATPARWRGHRTLLIDGSGFGMPDTPELASFFGLAPNQKPGIGFPVGRLVALFDAATCLLLDVAVATFRVGDLTLAKATRAWLRAGDVVVGDRGFCSFAHLAVLLGMSVHGVFRMHHRRLHDGPTRRQRRRRRANGNLREETVLVRRIGPGDEVVEWMMPSQPVAWLNQEELRVLPRFLRVRVIRFRVSRDGWRTRNVVLATTLLDPARYSAPEIADLYLRRWRIETSLRHLKRTMGMNVLRCKSADGVMKEVAAFALVYNLVRLVMLQAAGSQGVDPDRVSFVDALRWLQTASPGDPPPRLKINPLRGCRVEPRMVKRRHGRTFPLLTRKRSDVRAYLADLPRRLI